LTQVRARLADDRGTDNPANGQIVDDPSMIYPALRCRSR
jgi:hypothetical protein